MNNTNINKRTIKVKLNLTTNQQIAILSSMADAKIVFNLFVKLACEHKSCSYMVLHKHGYNIAKELCPNMPTAYIQSVAKVACASVKAWNTNNRKKKWLYKGKKNRSTIPLNKLTFARRGNLSTISTNSDRIKVQFDIPEWFVNRYDVSNNDIQAGSIYFKNNQYWLCIVYKILTQPSQRKQNNIGVDRGLYNFVTMSDGTIISSKKAIAIKRKYQYNRSKLQQKGTRSAKRKLKKVAGREKRFMLDFNHVISKKLANNLDVACYILENLKGIRQQRKGKKINSWLSNWSYSQFQNFLEYKCMMQGIDVVYVDPRYTSQKCNQCGLIEKNNRKKSKYVCACGYKNHADINAALNIRDNYALSCSKDRPISSGQ